MTLDIDRNDQTLTAVLRGEVRWNDRLLVSSLARLLALSPATELAVDARHCTEMDRGSLAGVVSSLERMALVAGQAFRSVTP